MNPLRFVAKRSYKDIGYFECTLNTSKYVNVPAERKITLMHEMGHAFGLDENNSMPTSIMCQNSEGRTATKPSDDDVDGINAIY